MINKLKLQEKHLIILMFIILCIICFSLADVSASFLVEQLSVRFIRNGVLVLSLLIPVAAGMGINFAVTVGAMMAQAAYIFALNYQIYGGPGVVVVFLITIVLSVLFGWMIGKLMNRVKGKEMITSIVISAVANYIYQLIFMVGFGTVIPVKNENIVLNSGIGVKNLVDLKSYKDFFNSFASITVGGIKISIFLIIMICLVAFFCYYLLKTLFGQKIRAIGMDEEKARDNGIEVNKIRIIVIIISTVLAGIGEFIYLQNIGSLNVYTEHLNDDTFSCAALLVGGASIRHATVKNALLGVVLMHTLFVLSPMAGQNAFSNVALGEYFRSFIIYGVIAFALIMNIKIEKQKKKI